MTADAPQASIRAWGHAEALAVARWMLTQSWKLNATIVGGLRRYDHAVTAIEILTPMDDAYERIARFVQQPGETKPGKYLQAGRGFKDGFKEAHLTLDRLEAGSLACPGTSTDLMPVKVYRYDGGPEGNEGWATLIRTGPYDFARACLWRYSTTCQGESRDGYPHDEHGTRLACPTEAEAFRLLRMDPIPPRERQWHLIPGYKPTAKET